MPNMRTAQTMVTTPVMEATAPSLWYKDAVIYEVHIRAFADSNGDGIGDFRGLIGKLDYLQGLGVTALWLLPFFPSPLRDDGYDISDYTAVHPAYGTLDDFRELMDEAHRRGLRVIIELVLNHTSDQHPWFQRARTALPGSPERDFYVWSDSPEPYKEARVIFKDYERSNWTWDSAANAYFWHRFYGHQPDLNYDHPPVRQAIFDTVDFWLDMGVDGLRLDAVPYLAEVEGTSSENLPATHRFLRQLRQHVDARYTDRMLLAEANQWPEDAVTYFGDGDECHMAFNFPLMPRLFMALRTEDRLAVEDILAQTPAIPDSAQWALFLRNHDELTLEMVTDEERVYMYQAFAPAQEARVNLGIRRRLAPLLGNSRRRIELMNALLCSLPGTPVIYYGDEIGMGDNIYLGDRDGVRTPMQWSADRNAGFSAASPQRLYLPLIVDYEYHHEAVHVEAQESNPHSLLAFMKRLLSLRTQSRAFGRGSLQLLHPANHRVLAFIRTYDGERILVVANLSRFCQAVELDLREYPGMTPVEMFGRIPFWPIEDHPYPLTIGPHGFFWFRLEPTESIASAGSITGDQAPTPVITATDGWASVITGNHRSELEQVLPQFLARQPWIRGSGEGGLNARLLDAVPVPHEARPTWFAPVRVSYSDRDPELYLLALAFIPVDHDDPTKVSDVTPIARVHSDRDGDALVVDAIGEGAIDDVLRWLAKEPCTSLQGALGEIVLERTRHDELIAMPPLDGSARPPTDAHGSNPVFMSDEVVIKILRRINEGTNPEWEIGQVLTDGAFPNTPTVLGALQYRGTNQPQMTIAVLQANVENQGHAWDFTAGFLDHLIATAQTQGIVIAQPAELSVRDILAVAGETPPDPVAEQLETWLRLARLLGERTAELHRALAQVPSQPAFAPEPYTLQDRRSMYQAMRGQTARALRCLRQEALGLPDGDQRLAVALLDQEQEIYDRFRAMVRLTSPGYRIRGHGKLHLGQVLMTGEDVVFVDFEGIPDRLLEERRLKRSPMRDIAGMLHSMQLAALQAGVRHRGESADSPEQAAAIEALLSTWCRHARKAFVAAYLRIAVEDGFLPSTEEDQAVLLDGLLLERAVDDLENALLHRPSAVAVSMELLSRLLRNS